MIRLNLLPHREAARRARRQQFYRLVAMTAVLGSLLVVLGYTAIDGYIDRQEEKNEFLRSEIAVLDRQIGEIRRLREQTQALLARKRIIESLQQDRGETVHLLAEIARQVPEGVYLKSLRQDGRKIHLAGHAQSGARVSVLMRNLEASPWLERPELLEVKAVLVAKRRLNEFGLNIYLTRMNPEEDLFPGKK